MLRPGYRHGPCLYWVAMHIPQYWAQARLRHQTGLRHGASVQRWGWSDESRQQAQDHAQQRAQQALDELLHPGRDKTGFKRMEWLGEYGLDAATPIREEVLERRGNTVLTRNSYGARCLNTEEVAIADIDLAQPTRPPGFPLLSLTAVVLVLLLSLGMTGNSQLLALGLAAAVAIRLVPKFVQWARARQAGPGPDPRAQMLERIEAFAAAHFGWGLRVYETPKGFRLILTHACYPPGHGDVQQLFSALQVDPLYAMLCQKQQCFRARVSAKPWRMGMGGLGGTLRRWPLEDAQLAQRQQWSREYDSKAQGFAACRLLKQIGPEAMAVQDFVLWHDQSCQALSQLKLA